MGCQAYGKLRLAVSIRMGLGAWHWTCALDGFLIMFRTSSQNGPRLSLPVEINAGGNNDLPYFYIVYTHAPIHSCLAIPQNVLTAGNWLIMYVACSPLHVHTLVEREERWGEPGKYYHMMMVEATPF